ncbi:MAG: peptide-methionine (S)-S-oxide reductase MsrA [Betaproteobacteria bacterium]|nr:MAG: peptide-methionine (S)-S-oxide reductase MsrA [Betaproteobacteria bacterium]
MKATRASEQAHVAQRRDAGANAQLEHIALAGGCFWCLEAVYEQVDGVHAVESGYSNGHVQRPSYEQVCRGDTGHAEVVRVSFDPARITLREVLEIFFSIHDPTTLNRQGNDVGTQYRSGIYFESPQQEAAAREVLAEADAAHGGRVVTELQPLANYSRAEDYHQHYFANHPEQGYCAFVVAPKVEKFRKTFAARLKRS